MAKSKSKSTARKKTQVNSKAKSKSKLNAKVSAKKNPPKKAARPAKKAVKQLAVKSISANKTKASMPKKQALPQAPKAGIPKAHALASILSPLADRVLVQVMPGERVTPGGLIIPDTVALTGHLRATVSAVGPGIRSKKGRLQPLDVKIGDKVLITEYAGDEIEVLGVKAKLIRESEILGVIDSE